MNEAKLAEFQRILSLASAVHLVVPLGATGFGKGGDVVVPGHPSGAPGYYAHSFAGGMFFSERWVFFAYAINSSSTGMQVKDTLEQWQAAVVGATKLVFDALS